MQSLQKAHWITALGLTAVAVTDHEDELLPAPRPNRNHEPPAIGDAITFTPNYAGLVGLFTSKYVRKLYVGGPGATS